MEKVKIFGLGCQYGGAVWGVGLGFWRQYFLKIEVLLRFWRLIYVIGGLFKVKVISKIVVKFYLSRWHFFD